MARRHNNEEDEKSWLIERRTLLKLSSAAVIGAGATTTLGTASAATVDLGAEGLSDGDDLTPYLEDHWQGGNEVHVPEGSYTLSNPSALGISTDQDATLVGDGEVIADHGTTSNSWNIEAEGSAHVRVENITLKGKDSGGDSKIRPYAPSSDGVVELVNFNRPDGTNDGDEATGFYVPGSHAGLVRFINCHVEGFSDNGIYASSPGKEANGPVEVYGGLYKNNDTAGVRLGSEGSKAISVVVVNDTHAPGVSGGNAQRGIRIREPGPVEIRDCDITHLDESGVAAPIDVENEKFESSRDGSTAVTGTRIRNDTGNPVFDCESDAYDISCTDLHLTGSGSRQLDGTGPFENVVEDDDADTPTTEKRFVDPDSLEPVDSGGGSGGSGGDNTDDDPDDNTDDDSDASGQLVEVVAADGGPVFHYSLLAAGAATKVTDVGSMSSEGNDSIEENDDGTTQIEGRVGNGFGDCFRVEGDLLTFESDTDPENYTIRVDGQDVDPSEIGSDGDDSDDDEGEQTEVAVVAADGGPAFHYTLLVAGSAAKVTGAGSMSSEGNDSIEENDDGTTQIEGRVGNGFGDTFAIEGSLDSFEADTDAENYTLLVDGQEVDPADLGGSDGSDGSDEPTLPNRISFDAADGQEGTYTFEVSGEVSPDPDGGSLEDGDVISGSVVEGDVSDDADAYRFSGDIVSLQLTGAATVSIEANE